ncbi:hypothetical protein [Singulisphaera acidiphila]|uniref:Uncharacterized protein n=1 Tax=Singulisphaera acidiphila (strain ATCC BAA-1392 / DSM 18658 / VKM B-2454 / MOB10) TaxID=886293 RepID=L0DG91_SINAD|nr:hypothetical protein [Singulisphaera acidiphila]AGA28292.1 hypothetical protein Sinac_4077 [Singulisphaera acidiphila DSM 18658]
MRPPRVKLRAGIFKNQLRRPHLSIAEIMGLVAVVAVCCVWPVMIGPLLASSLTWLPHVKAGLSLIWTIIVIGSVLGFIMAKTATIPARSVALSRDAANPPFSDLTQGQRFHQDATPPAIVIRHKSGSAKP